MNEQELDDRIQDLLAEWELGREAGRELSVQEMCLDSPELASELQRNIDRLRKTDWMLQDAASHTDANRGSEETFDRGCELTIDEFVTSLTGSGILTDEQLLAMRAEARNSPASAGALAKRMIEKGLLTSYQACVILKRGSGPLLLDRYIILDSLGSGGMGVVFKALHRSMERIVAIKVLPEFAVDSPSKVRRFQREVKSAAQLSHPNIVTAFDAHERNGTYFLVMEYVDGENLRDWIANHGPLQVVDAASILDQVAAGLHAAHSNGMVHRDVKPSNIMLAKDGTAKLLDLGLARTMQQASGRDESELTTDGMGMGTASYMSPEQALDARSADARSDLYSLGCTLYFLLTGSPPFQGDTTVQTIVAHREVPVPKLRETRSDVDDVLESIFQRLIAKQPDDRFSSAAELRTALRESALQPAIKPRPAHSVHQIPRRVAWQRNWRWVAAGCTVIALIAFLVGAIVQGRNDIFAKHRGVARWVLNEGGLVTAKTEFGEELLEDTADLPEGDFRIVGLELYNSPTLDPLRHLDGLQTLTLYDVENPELEKIVAVNSITDLALLGCGVVDADVRQFAKLPLLTSLALDDSQLTDDGAKQLAYFVNLKSLSLSGPQLTGGVLRHLQKLANLKTLDLTQLAVNAKDAEHLPTGITELSLIGCQIENGIFATLKRLVRLQSLDLQGAQLPANGIAELTQLSELMLLDLSDTQIGAASIKALKDLQTLRVLRVSGVPLTDEHIEALSQLDGVEDLDVSRTNLNDTQLLRLISLENLQVLQVDGTNVTSQGVNRFEQQRGEVLLYLDESMM